MTTHKQGETATITFQSHCSIVDVEADSDQLKVLTKEVKKIIVNASNITEIDMAYLQLILSLKSTANANDIMFEIQSKSAKLEHVLELCGLKEL